LLDAGEFHDAETQCKTAAELLEHSAGANHPGLAPILSNLGTCELELRRTASAIEVLERAERLRVQSNVTGPDVAFGEFALARALYADGRDKPRARALAKRALERVPDPSQPDHARITAWLRTHDR
jgi:tetratricopeptide (TPR) repeat protein